MANIPLDDLDRELERRGHRFVPYADDLMVLIKSERAGQRVKASLTTYTAQLLTWKADKWLARCIAWASSYSFFSSAPYAKCGCSGPDHR